MEDLIRAVSAAMQANDTAQAIRLLGANPAATRWVLAEYLFTEPEMLERLVAAGFDLAGYEATQQPVLAMAVAAEAPDELIAKLVAHGADVQKAIASMLAGGDEEAAKRLEAYAPAPSGSGRYGIVALGALADAAETGAAAGQERDAVTANLESRDQYGETKLFGHAANHRTRQVERLLAAGADPDAANNEGWTPLHVALDNEAKEAARLLIEGGADVNARTHQGDTPLDMIRGRRGFKRLTKLLLDRGAVSGSAGDNARVLPIAPGEPWADAAETQVNALPEAQAQAWAALMRHGIEAEGSKPTKSWLKQLPALIEPIGEDALRDRLVDWLPRVAEPRPQAPEPPAGEPWPNPIEVSVWYLHGDNVLALRGLLWAAPRRDDSELVRAITQVAEACLKKVPEVGLRMAKLANAALQTLAEMPGERALMELALLAMKTKYSAARSNIDRVLNKLAAARGTTVDEVLANAVPDLGLSEVGRYSETLGDFTAELALVATGKTELKWRNADGKLQKSVPAAVKRTDPDAVKRIKALAKDLEQASIAQRRRLETVYLTGTTWTPESWMRDLDHPVTGSVGRRLIWRLQHAGGGGHRDCIWGESGPIGLDGQPVDTHGTTEVELWHPIHADADTISAWRALLTERGITQPFKQAHREVYPLTDAERHTRDHSRRYGGHILRQHQVHALCQERGWKQDLGGDWDLDGDISPRRKIPSTALSARFEMALEETLGESEAGIVLHMRSGALRFAYDDEGDDEGGDTVDLATVSPLVLSEVMRDLDLFVAVASVGNDPDWAHRRDVAYWRDCQTSALGPVAQTRRAVLATLIPRLKIAPQLELDQRHLRVQGKLHHYRIHLGSTNIHIEPGNRYLCIVQGWKDQRVFLPFEGDNGLALILSKAVLLAADDKIKDPTILSQLRRA